MYMGLNKIDIDILCYRCRKKTTEVQGLTVEEWYDVFYNDPRFEEHRSNHQMANSIIVRALLNEHDSCGCLTKMYACG